MINEKPKTKRLILMPLFMIVLSIAIFYFYKSWIISISAVVILSVLLFLYSITKKKLDKSRKIKKIESVFPDFLQLMASNLRAGMTIDKALLLSSRKEFAPLDEEILILGKDLVTGKEMSYALNEMAKRIGSEKLRKTISVINSGLKSGGNIAILLQETAANMREKEFVEKKAASNVLMYVIFIIFAVCIGSPILFGLSTVLVKVISGLLATVPQIESSTLSLPFTLTKINISVNFVTYFSLVFLAVTNILGSMVLGLVSKGEEKEGLKYLIPFLVISTTIFLVVKIVLAGFFENLI